MATRLICLLSILSTAALAHTRLGGQDLGQAPPGFSSQGKAMVPVDFQFVELTLNFDVSAKRATGSARIEFFAREGGYPLLDLVPNANSVRLNGKDLGGAALASVSTPDSTTRLRFVDAEVDAFSNNLLEIGYTLPSDKLTWSSSGVSIGFFMSDVGQDRAFLEQYAPSNLEFDQFQMTTQVRLTGARGPHQLFTNGRATELGNTTGWNIDFPAYFTTSSFYLHLTEKSLAVERGVFQGMGGSIPVTVYSSSASLASSGLTRTLSVLKELEGTYGAYAHDSFTAYITSGGGGMEHCGATMTSLGALGHEITHSWFARGVMPANGNSGWMDEAIASWRDNGYPKASGGPNRPPVNLASFSPYRRTTPNAAYTDGARLMSELDYLFSQSQGGLRPVLKKLFDQHQRSTVTTGSFHSTLEDLTGDSLGAIFDRYVYGKNVRFPRWLKKLLGGGGEGPTPLVSLHPRAYTAAELAEHR